MEEKQSYKVLLGCTGSVASCKAFPLINLLQAIRIRDLGIEVNIVATRNALPFMQINHLKNMCNVFVDMELSTSKSGSNYEAQILWADLLVIAPIDANTLAKAANGLCDNLLTYIMRNWDYEKPLLFCPAMNTHMWNHPITATHVSTLKEFGYIEVPCVSKNLICGDVGFGGMAEINTISNKVAEILSVIKK